MASLQGLFAKCAQLDLNRVATRTFTRQRTWNECLDRVSRFAAGMSALGYGDGERVAILGLNSDNYLETIFAIPWAGLSMVPLNIRWAVPENIYALNDCGARVLVFDDAFLPQVEEFRHEVPDLEMFVYFGDNDAPEWAVSYEDMIVSNEPAPQSERSDDDTVGIFYTGGTTGFPKGVEHSHKAILTSATGASPLMPLERDSLFLHAAPMFHMADFVGTIMSVMVGSSHVFIPMFDPALFLKAVESFKVTASLLVPAMIKMVLQHPALDKTDLSTLVMLAYGASPMPAEILDVIIKRWPHIDLVQAYGQTEMAPIVTMMTAEDHRGGGEILKSAGRPTSVSEVRIVDGDGNECPLGISGEVVVRGDHAMKGYWNKPEETAKALRDGWVYSGDAGYFDAEGYLYIVDRVKDMIITGGENVFTGEVENCLISHPAVQDVAVIGIPDDDWGEAVHAIVILADRADVSEQELIDHCHNSIAGYKCPKSITYRDEPMPLSGAGKVLKTELRKPYWKDQERQVH